MLKVIIQSKGIRITFPVYNTSRKSSTLYLNSRNNKITLKLSIHNKPVIKKLYLYLP